MAALPISGTSAEIQTVSVFLSYSWDTPEHVAWVAHLAHRLKQDRISITWDDQVRAGADLALFMQQAHTADRVLLICTPDYKQKADRLIGGVGYETRLLVARLIRDQRNANVIPLLRRGSWEQSGPIWLGSTRYLDLRGDPYPEQQYQRLLESLNQHTLTPAPPIPVPPKPALRPAPIRLALFATFLLVTYKGPWMAQHQFTYRPRNQWAQPNPMVSQYLVFTAVRFAASCLLLAGAFWLTRVEYQRGISGKSVSIPAELTVGLAALAGATCFFSMLNLSALDAQKVASALALSLPERLGYVYLCLGFLTFIHGIRKTAFAERSPA